jgi:hypothetical protein
MLVILDYLSVKVDNMQREIWDWLWSGTVWSIGELKKNSLATNIALVFAAIGALNVYYEVKKHWRESRERKYGNVHAQLFCFASGEIEAVFTNLARSPVPVRFACFQIKGLHNYYQVGIANVAIQIADVTEIVQWDTLGLTGVLLPLEWGKVHKDILHESESYVISHATRAFGAVIRKEKLTGLKYQCRGVLITLTNRKYLTEWSTPLGIPQE